MIDFKSIKHLKSKKEKTSNILIIKCREIHINIILAIKFLEKIIDYPIIVK